MENKPTLIIGASPNPTRYSYLATIKLAENGHTVYPLGIKSGKIGNHDIMLSEISNVFIHTITLYISQKHQKQWEDYILKLKPKRIIFNPGAENEELFAKASGQGIECLEACTLVMLASGSY